MLAGGPRGAERLEDGVDRVALGHVDVAEAGRLGGKRAQQVADCILVDCCELDDRCDPTRGPVDQRPARVRNRLRVGERGDGCVRTLPWQPVLAATDRVRHRRRGDFVFLKHKPSVERPHLEVADVGVAELLVQLDRGLVLDQHLEPDPDDAAVPRVRLDRSHQLLSDPLAAAARDHADAADPGVLAPDGEHADADVLAAVGCHERAAEVVVPAPGHRREGRLVDRDGHEVALVAGGEERRQLRVGAAGGGLERDGSHCSEPTPGPAPPTAPDRKRRCAVGSR